MVIEVIIQIMNHFDKKNIILLVIASIAIAGTLLILIEKSVTKKLSQTTTIPEVKIYRNEEWGFEFEYPEDWKIIENPYGSPFSRFNLIIVPIKGKYLPDPVLINIVTPEFADRAAVSRKNLGAVEVDVIIGGTRGIKYQYTEQFSTISIDLLFGEYRVILGAKKQYEDVFNQVIASFKFIESNKSNQ